MRPCRLFFLFLVVMAMVDGTMAISAKRLSRAKAADLPELQNLVAILGLTDLCLSTEARYTRHLAVSDGMAPFMDHPGAIDHFPSGSFFYPLFRP